MRGKSALSWLRGPAPLALLLVVGAVIYLFTAQYIREQQRLVESSYAAFDERLSTVQNALDHMVTYLDLASNWTERYWNTDIDKLMSSAYRDQFSYHADGDYFDSAPLTEGGGSVSGAGTYLDRSDEFRKDLGLAALLLTYFRGAREESEAILQSYFFSVNGINSNYPPLPVGVLIDQFGPTLRDAYGHFFDPHEGKHLNPERAPYFLDPYIDRTGHGLVVTYVHPVYEGDRFVGVMASDITVQLLQTFTEDLPGLGSRLMLVAQDGQVIADSDAERFSDDQLLSDRLPEPLREFNDEILAGDLMTRIGHRYVNARRLTNAPWTFIQIIDRANVSAILLGSQITYAAGGLALVSLFFIAYLAIRRQRSEAALRATEATYQEIFNSTGEIIFVHDADTGRILEANSAFTIASGYDLEETPGLAVGDLSAGDAIYTQEKADNHIQRAVAGDAHSFEWRFHTKNGEPRWVEVNLRPATIRGVKRVLAVSRDIGERRRYEAELNQHRAHLEDLVEERTRELKETQEELVNTEKLAVLGQLTATVSHELRNPLGTIANSLFVIGSNLTEPSRLVESAVERATRNVARCGDIVDELLDYTRTQRLDKSPVQIERFLSEVVGELERPSGITIELNLRAEGLVSLDSERIRRCVSNLVDNACQAMTQHQKTGSLRICSDIEDNRLTVRVQDNGPGIPDGMADRVFEPLFSTKGFGVGLGLPMARQIVRAHGGDLKLDNHPDGGAVAELWLPLVDRSKSDV